MQKCNATQKSQMQCNLIPNLCDMMRLRLCVIGLDLYERNKSHALSQPIYSPNFGDALLEVI